MPTGSRLWTPANIGNDLKLWMRPEAIRPFNGESTNTSDLSQNKWLDSSSFRSEMGAPDNPGFVTITREYETEGANKTYLSIVTLALTSLVLYLS